MKEVKIPEVGKEYIIHVKPEYTYDVRVSDFFSIEDKRIYKITGLDNSLDGFYATTKINGEEREVYVNGPFWRIRCFNFYPVEDIAPYPVKTNRFALLDLED